MGALLRSLGSETEISIGLLEKPMMKPYCKCGRFENTIGFVLREEAAEYYFANLDIWNRTTFIEVPLRVVDIYYF
jgi:hypothetical protein